jgi:hypothetical protein
MMRISEDEWRLIRHDFPPLDQRPCRLGMQIEDAQYQHVDICIKERSSAGDFDVDLHKDDDRESRMKMTSQSHFEPFPLYG